MPQNDLNYGERRCPACPGKTREKTAAGVRVDVCHTCKGAWFSAGELQSALNSKPQIDSDRWPGKRRCPECQARMDIVLLRHKDVEIDQCPDCHGIWLDQGEFQKLRKPEKTQEKCEANEPSGIKLKLLNFIDNAFDRLSY